MDGTDDMLWNVSEEDGNVRNECVCVCVCVCVWKMKLLIVKIETWALTGKGR